MNFNEDFFGNIEKKTKVNKDTLINLAKRLNEDNMKDENVLSSIIQDLANITGKKVSKEKRDLAPFALRPCQGCAAASTGASLVPFDSSDRSELSGLSVCYKAASSPSSVFSLKGCPPKSKHHGLHRSSHPQQCF
jgi:hypothetical protein